MLDRITFRLASLTDLSALAEMRWENRMEGQANASDAQREQFLDVCSQFLEDGLASGRWAFWLAVTPDGCIRASAFVQVIDKVPRPSHPWARWGYVTNVYTQPELRGQGIGGMLIERVKEWGQEQGLELLLLWPSETSVEFYERHGFNQHTDCMEIELNTYLE